jgi:hypothetical protein
MAWIRACNLGAWCDAVSVLFGGALAESEWKGIRRGISEATGAAFRFRLGGRDGVEVAAILDEPSDIAHVWLVANASQGTVEGITMMCKSFRIEGTIRPAEDIGSEPLG